jgi:thiosulfate dehydrogenase
MRENPLLRAIPALTSCIVLCLVFVVSAVCLLLKPPSVDVAELPDVKPVATPLVVKPSEEKALWQPPDSTRIPNTPEGDLIRYGRELVAHTAIYLGPSGTVMALSNGMNCQNCHLKAGKKPFGNNYSGVAATYPKFRPRSGSIETVEKRVNDCIERSLNGKKLDESSKEMQAFVSYITWVGNEVAKGIYPKGAGIAEIPLMDRPADPLKGKIVYEKHCSRCHGTNGEGLRADNGIEWKYPPLYSDNSYNVGAGLFRLSRFAGYVKANMPYDAATFDNPVLTDEEAWDVAAFINSRPRPSKKFPADWPDISTKPYDHPFGPYTDAFTEDQHKFGPFGPIKATAKKK